MKQTSKQLKARKHEKLTLTTSKLSSHAQEVAVEGAGSRFKKVGVSLDEREVLVLVGNPTKHLYCTSIPES